MTNFFGQGANRGYVGQLTDYLRNANKPQPQAFGQNQVPNGLSTYFGNPGLSSASQPASSTAGATPNSVSGPLNPGAAATTQPGLQLAAPTGGTGAGTNNNIVYFQGHPYDVSNSGQLNDFFGARNAYLDNLATTQYNQYALPIQQSLESGERTNTEALAAINRDVGNLGDQYGQYQRGYGNDVYNLNQGYDTGAVNRQNFFAQASPNAYQSSQGSGEQYAMQQRDRALGDLAASKSLTDKNYAQQQAGLEQQRGDLGFNYNLFTQNAQNALNNYKTLLTNYYGGQKDQNATQAYADAAANAQYGGPKPTAGQFGYNYQNSGPLNAVNTDISQYTPAINFSGITGSPGANYFGSFAPTIGSQNTSPLSQYLGNADTPQNRAYIKQYLSGKTVPIGA